MFSSALLFMDDCEQWQCTSELRHWIHLKWNLSDWWMTAEIWMCLSWAFDLNGGMEICVTVLCNCALILQLHQWCIIIILGCAANWRHFYFPHEKTSRGAHLFFKLFLLQILFSDCPPSSILCICSSINDHYSSSSSSWSYSCFVDMLDDNCMSAQIHA